VSDLLIRDIPDEVLAALDARAIRLGLSRTEYLRRRLAQDAAVEQGPVDVEALARFSDTFADLADPAVMDRAWR
jgi:plasmid stability protein